MNRENYLYGHLSAGFSIFVWGTTFISTKVLLESFTPLEILFFRFIIGYAALWIAYPHIMKVKGLKEEMLFALAGLCGVTLYFLMENFALTYTLTSNVSIIIAVAPFFTALFDWFLFKGKKPGLRFLAGFTTAIIGIGLISLQGSSGMELNPKGDFLALTAAITWAAYSVITKKLGEYGHGTVETTRRIFFYGLLFMIPVLAVLPFRLGLTRLLNITNLLNILFLGLGASALCFATWNFAVKVLGSVKTSVYIYAVPVITVITSMLILKERLTAQSFAGILLTLAGLIISESRFKKPDVKKH
ncbi:DMT family transporter [Lacrimispora sp.]|uniref:DMT family transporter n=1 Tax=Lacrimispora sp. TaxID=2719234 RepID=UPI003992DBCA